MKYCIVSFFCSLMLFVLEAHGIPPVTDYMAGVVKKQTRPFHRGFLKLKKGPPLSLSGRPDFFGCEENAYPPNASHQIPLFALNLTDEPRHRWTLLVASKKLELQNLVDYMKEFLVTVFGQKAFNFLNSSLPKVTATLPSPYSEEILGIADAAELSVSDVTLFNIFYEVFSFCTSVIFTDADCEIHHGRNLDFGLFLGWDAANRTWRVAELLKPLVVQVDWMKNEQTLYQSINFVGHIGILTAMKMDAFTFTLNERFTLNGGYVGLIEWIFFGDYKQKWVTFLTREVMETATTYKDAQKMLAKARLLAPVYFILGGNNSKDASIITRYRNTFDILELGATKHGQGSWYLVETNYDHWKDVPFFDDRRHPTIQCLEKSGQAGDPLKTLYNVLSTRPVLNKLTTYTTLMNVREGIVGTWIRSCPDPCWPW